VRSLDWVDLGFGAQLFLYASSKPSIYRDYLADKESEVKMTVSKEIACLSVSARLLSRKDVKKHD
jgi:hypothetical protein